MDAGAGGAGAPGGDGGAGPGGGAGTGGAAAWRWTRETTTTSRLAAVWASGPADVWATPRMQHSHGDGQWAEQPVTDPHFAPVDVSGSGPHDIYVATIEPGAGGNGLVYHSTGDGTWSAVGGGYAGQDNAVYAHDASVYIGSSWGGLWRSTDHGARFAPVAVAANQPIIDIDGSGADVVASALPTNPPQPGQPRSFLLLSHDDGATWSVAGHAGVLEHVATAGGVVYAIAYTSILRSDDGGASWSDVTPRGVSIQPYALLAVSAGEVWASDTSGHGLLHSSDGGQSWQIDLGSSDPLYGLCAAGPNAVYATGVGFVLHGQR